MRKIILLSILVLCFIPSLSYSISCPPGTHYGTDAYGPTCITDQIVNSPNTSHSTSSSGGGGTVIGIVVFIFIIIIIAGIIKSSGKPKTVEYKDVQRKGFTNSTKELVKERQNGRCANPSCNKFPTHWEFDHINGKGDNSPSNCQGLCRDCHQDKTLKDHY